MPITAIPFKSPPPYELPLHILDAVRESPFASAADQVLALLQQIDSADAMLVGLLDANGRLQPGPFWARNERGIQAMQGVHDAIRVRDLTLDSAAGREDFMGQAITGGKPLLMMGEVANGEPHPFPAEFAQYLLEGSERNNVGFLYVFPLADPQGKAHGALALHRWLASGPLNHDQPAIVHALLGALGERAAIPATPVPDSL